MLFLRKHKRMRLLAAVLCAAVSLCVLAFVVLQVSHDCCDENCPVCALLQKCVCRTAFFLLSFALFSVTAAHGICGVPDPGSCAPVFAATPVREKTRINM